jgi:hypothetical protein
VEGEIHGTRVMGESGDVQASLGPRCAYGPRRLRGRCAEITSTGKVFGNIACAIVVAEGATFRGASKMAHRSRQPAGRLESTRDTASPAGAPAQSSSTTANDHEDLNRKEIKDNEYRLAVPGGVKTSPRRDTRSCRERRHVGSGVSNDDYHAAGRSSRPQRTRSRESRDDRQGEGTSPRKWRTPRGRSFTASTSRR